MIRINRRINKYNVTANLLRAPKELQTRTTKNIVYITMAVI
jgi:hypothetical protein